MHETLIGWFFVILSTPLLVLASVRFDLFQRYFGCLSYWRFPNFLRFSIIWIPASQRSCILGMSMVFTLGLLDFSVQSKAFPEGLVLSIIAIQSLLVIPMAISDYRISRRKSKEREQAGSSSGA